MTTCIHLSRTANTDNRWGNGERVLLVLFHRAHQGHEFGPTAQTQHIQPGEDIGRAPNRTHRGVRYPSIANPGNLTNGTDAADLYTELPPVPPQRRRTPSSAAKASFPLSRDHASDPCTPRPARITRTDNSFPLIRSTRTPFPVPLPSRPEPARNATRVPSGESRGSLASMGMVRRQRFPPSGPTRYTEPSNAYTRPGAKLPAQSTGAANGFHVVKIGLWRCNGHWRIEPHRDRLPADGSRRGRRRRPRHVRSLSAYKLPDCRNMPPSMKNVLPVTYADSSEARYTARFAISSGCPMRPTGISASNWAN